MRFVAILLPALLVLFACHQDDSLTSADVADAAERRARRSAGSSWTARSEMSPTFDGSVWPPSLGARRPARQAATTGWMGTCRWNAAG